MLLGVHAYSNWPISLGPSVGDACALYHPKGKQGKKSVPEASGDKGGDQECRGTRILREE